MRHTVLLVVRSMMVEEGCCSRLMCLLISPVDYCLLHQDNVMAPVRRINARKVVGGNIEKGRKDVCRSEERRVGKECPV